MSLTGGEKQLIAILERKDLQRFTVTQLHECYVGENASDNVNAKTTRQFVYRNLVKLEKNGLVSQLQGKKGKAIHYEYNKELVQDSRLGSSSEDEKFILSIHENLKRCKLDFLTFTGEVEALKKLNHDGHSFSGLVGQKFKEAVDNSAKTLGEVRLLESLLQEVVNPGV